MKNKGLSEVAKQHPVHWENKKRPRGWRGKVYGLVVHTTGSGLPSRAKKAGRSPVDMGIEYYLGEYGCHYICGWDGVVTQIANEDQQANGVGTGDQINSNPWENDLPPSLVTRWHNRWRHTEAESPLELFPTKYVNSCYVHVEMPPCVFPYGKKNITEAEPRAEGLRFTQEQHDTIVKLAIDVADRNGWKGEWWKTGRLVGHEDVTPITRHDKYGGWDPGYLRKTPRFDWDYVYAQIEKEYAAREESARVLEEAEKAVQPAPGEKDSMTRLIEWFTAWVYGLFGRRL